MSKKIEDILEGFMVLGCLALIPLTLWMLVLFFMQEVLG